MYIIDNIITYSPYSPYYVTITSANDSAVSLSRGTDVFRLVALLLNMICLMHFYTKSDICPFWYNFDTVLCQFLETGT